MLPTHYSASYIKGGYELSSSKVSHMPPPVRALPCPALPCPAAKKREDPELSLLKQLSPSDLCHDNLISIHHFSDQPLRPVKGGHGFIIMVSKLLILILFPLPLQEDPMERGARFFAIMVVT